jgi:prepilin-type N-terminal cleavage/methylation domain-containing protein
MSGNHGGMTLIEVLLAMGIFLVGITALLGLFHYGGGLEQKARSHATIAPLLPSLVEEVRDQAFELKSNGTIGVMREFNHRPVSGAPGYHYQVEAKPTDDPVLYQATMLVYRDSPERPAVTLRFLLPKQVSIARRLDSQ